MPPPKFCYPLPFLKTWIKPCWEGRREWGRPVVAVALDFASAYDTVDREALFRVLEGEGM